MWTKDNKRGRVHQQMVTAVVRVKQTVDLLLHICVAGSSCTSVL